MSRVAEPYLHTQETPMRPEVGTQAQFKKRKAPKTYRYDSSLDPALSWDDGASRTIGDWLLGLIVEASKLPSPHRFSEPKRFLGVGNAVLMTVNRVYIPKADGRQRPLGVTALEDKLVQRATVEVLNAIYETDFLGFSYGFRPGRNQHKALDALWCGLQEKRVNWVLDLDVRSFFDMLSHDWLVRFLQHRIADRRVVRLIQKWLNAGVLEKGKRTFAEAGSPQGGSASPLLANLYLHYVFDLWVQAWRRKRAHGDMIVVRYADDIVVGFEFKDEAERFWAELKERMQKFQLELHPEKTRLIEFGRHAAKNRKRAGLGKPETFSFLGFTHLCGKTKRGRFLVLRQTIRKRMQAKLQEVKAELRRRMHDPVPEVGAWLKSVVGGHFRYFGVPGNGHAMNYFRFTVSNLWHRALCRRSQHGRVKWDRMTRLIRRWLPPAHICHPYPTRRLRVTT
jgi:group II intron reverse transcriptase/maturase